MKRYDRDPHAQTCQFVFMLPQLRQVFATRQSGQVAMKHQQQPLTGVVIELVQPTGDIRQLEGFGRASKFRLHAAGKIPDCRSSKYDAS